MSDHNKTKAQLTKELVDLRQRLKNLEAKTAQMEASEQRFIKIFNHSNDAIFLIEPMQDAIVDANPKACSMLGYTRDELLSIGISAIHPYEIAKMQAFAQSVIELKHGWTNNLSCLTKSGKLLSAEISASLMSINGRDCILALVRDTSKRKEDETRIQREVARADALARIAARLNAQLDLKAVLTAVCEESVKALNTPAAAVLLYDETQEVFYPKATIGLPPEFREQYIPNSRAIYDQYPHQYGSQIAIPNLQSLPNLPNQDLFTRYHIQAIAVVSLDRKDHLLGALSVYAFDPTRVFSEEDITLLRGLADQAATAIRNAYLFKAEQRRSEQFRLISEVSQHISSILAVDELLKQIAYSIQAFGNYHHTGLAMVEGDEVVYKAGTGYLWGEIKKAAGDTAPRLKVGKEGGLSGWVAETGQPVLVPDVSQEPRYFSGPYSRTRSELVVPIKIKERMIGLVNIESEELNAFDVSDMVMIQFLADQAAIAIENAQLYEQTHQLAAIEERQRLARDLHDSVAQSLYSQTLYAEAAIRQLATGATTITADHLRELKQTAQQALQEMRLLIFELRPPALKEEGWATAVQTRLDAVERRSGLETELHVEGQFDLTPALEVDLYWITHEALNNILKHAQADKVFLQLSLDGHLLTLRIIDNGIGFNIDNIPDGGLGLQGMQERAEKWQGSFTVHSSSGQGTHIQIEVPQ